MIKKISTLNQLKELSKGKVLVDFFATWCGPCSRIAPTYHKFADQFKDKITFTQVDVDEAADVCEKYGVTSMPTFIALKDGKEISRIVGGDEQQLLNFINNLNKV